MKQLLTTTFLILTQIVYAQTDLKKTEILVLGTHHLSQIKEFQPTLLEELIKELSDQKFDAVLVENMPTQLLLDIEARNDTSFTELLSSFGGQRLEIARKMQKQLGLDYQSAMKRASEIKKPANDEERLKLIEYYLASGEIASATLHFGYLKNKPVSTTTINKETIALLSWNIGSSNEIYSIGIRLAQNLKLDQIHYIDNFQDEALLLKNNPTFIADYMSNQEKFENVGNHPVFQKTNELVKKGVSDKNLIELYRFLNSQEFQSGDFDAQWKIWFTTNFETKTDRSRYSLWEMRNLAITSNILETISDYPGKRILVIIGASHKSFIEKYLKQIPDLELLEFR